MKTFDILAIAAAFSITAGFVSCSDDKPVQELPVIEMADGTGIPVDIDWHEIVNEGSCSCKYTVRLDKTADTPMICDIAVDSALVDVFNESNGTSCVIMPATVYSIDSETAIIKAGEDVSDTLSVSFSSLYGLEEGVEYLLPLTAIPDETRVDKFATSSRSTSYFRLSIDGKLDYIPGLDMRTYSTDMYATLSFADGEVVEIPDNTHTFEMLIYPYEWHSGTNYIGTWKGKDLNNSNETFSGCEFRAYGTTGISTIGNRQCDLTTYSKGITMPTRKWLRLTVTCDGSQTGQNSEIAYRLYVNGEEIASAKPTKRWGTSSSQRFQVGYTLTGIQFGGTSSSYYFNGLIADVRMWKKCLTAEEVAANLRTIASPSSEDLFGWWKIDEAEGNILKDSSGNGRDLTFPESATVVWGAEINNLPSGE